MAEITFREKLHELIDHTPEDKLREIYQLLEEGDEYTDEFKAELDAEFEDYQRNKEGIPKQEVDLMIQEILYGKK